MPSPSLHGRHSSSQRRYRLCACPARQWRYEWLAGGAIPYDRRFTLVRDPYGDGKAAAGPRFFDHGASDVYAGLPDGLGIMFNPSIVREDL